VRIGFATVTKLSVSLCVFSCAASSKRSQPPTGASGNQRTAYGLAAARYVCLVVDFIYVEGFALVAYYSRLLPASLTTLTTRQIARCYWQVCCHAAFNAHLARLPHERSSLASTVVKWRSLANIELEFFLAGIHRAEPDQRNIRGRTACHGTLGILAYQQPVPARSRSLLIRCVATEYCLAKKRLTCEHPA
jgi:hypothetical protein